MAVVVEQEALNITGKKAIGIDIFAAALRQLPAILNKCRVHCLAVDRRAKENQYIRIINPLFSLRS